GRADPGARTKLDNALDHGSRRPAGAPRTQTLSFRVQAEDQPLAARSAGESADLLLDTLIVLPLLDSGIDRPGGLEGPGSVLQPACRRVDGCDMQLQVHAPRTSLRRAFEERQGCSIIAEQVLDPPKRVCDD